MTRDLSPLARRFDAFVFDWDGTAVPDRSTDASDVRDLVERLCAAGATVAIVSGTHVGNIDGQLRARPVGPGRLLLALNRGSEVFVVDDTGPALLWRRDATPDEDEMLDRAAALTVRRLGEFGLRTEIVSERLNRRKIDLIPTPEWIDAPKARIGELLDAVEERLFGVGLRGLGQVVEIALDAAREVGLADPRVTTDVKHVEIGLTDKSHSGDWVFDDLWARGVGPGLALVAGDEFGSLGGLPGSDSFLLVDGSRGATVVTVGVEPEGVPDGIHRLAGGPAAFVALLRDQCARRDALEPPRIDEQRTWSVVVHGSGTEHPHADKALLTISDGCLATSGTTLVEHPDAAPRTLMAGVYTGTGPDTCLLAGPNWHVVTGVTASTTLHRRTLDLRTGILREEDVDDSSVHSVRFASADAPGTAALRAAYRGGVAVPVPLLGPDGPGVVDGGQVEDRAWMRVAGSDGGIVAAASQRVVSADDGTTRLERMAAFVGDPENTPEPAAALEHLDRAMDRGFETMLVEHRAAWAERWTDCDIVIEGDDELQQAVRFALFHLNGTVGEADEAAVGARGLTGTGYRGHVFWDADVFVLPFLAATRPAAARAMLEYRIRRLPQARAAAAAAGFGGTRFPWESAHSGRDVTPTSVRDLEHKLVPIRTGQLEDHIVADVAWAAACYIDWTGDDEFAHGPGRALLVETARYWATRIRTAADGTAHVFGVIGPDEYHEPVDDNAFTNVMARWNLRRGALALADDGDPAEARRWLELADALVDGYDPDSGIYEQFAGFHRLEPIVIEDVVPRRPVNADQVLGRDRVQGAQVVKQADVLMAYHLVPEEMIAESLEANLRFYEERTAHGSSLSPGIHASLFARVRDDRHALEALQLAARIDLDDVTMTTAEGVHLATLGSVWQALVFGFAGMRPGADGILTIDPRLPTAWTALEVTVRFRGVRVHLRKARGTATVSADGPVRVRLGDCEFEPEVRGSLLIRDRSGWQLRARRGTP
jgi:trehalose/maltose hydrolase-like predicted phosphorylase